MKLIRSYGLCTTGLALFLFSGCYYDANPPSQERLEEYRPFLALRVTNLNDNDRLLFRWREDGGAWQSFTSYLSVTPGGELYFSHLFSVNVTSLNIELTIDSNHNGQVDVGEMQWSSSTLSFSQSEDRAVLAIDRNDFS